MDPKWFIPDPDPALNFLSSGSGSRSRQKFRIHADPDPYPQQCNNLSMEYKMSSQTTVKKLNHFKSFIIVKYFCNYRFLRFADHHIHYRYSSKFIKDILLLENLLIGDEENISIFCKTIINRYLWVLKMCPNFCIIHFVSPILWVVGRRTNDELRCRSASVRTCIILRDSDIFSPSEGLWPVFRSRYCLVGATSSRLRLHLKCT